MAERFDQATLNVEGKLYRGWKEFSVAQSIKAISRSYSLSLTDRWAGQDKPWPILPGMECELFIDAGEPLVTGYVDRFAPRFDARSRGFEAAGRDKTADLVDCSSGQVPGEWSSALSIKRLAEILGKPFGVRVKVLTDVGPALPGFSMQTRAETGFEALDRIARERGLLVYSDGTGDIVISRAGKARCSSRLEQGKNLKSAEFEYDMKARFSEYIVLAQLEGADQSLPPETRFSLSGRATDEGVERYRPHIIMDSAADVVSPQRRARWEATTRAGKSQRVRATVAGFRQADGRLWTLNELVRIKAPWLNIDTELLISEITFSKTIKNGTETKLTLEPPEAFQELPKVDKEAQLRAIIRQETKK